jgi:hypothetical protein
MVGILLGGFMALGLSQMMMSEPGNKIYNIQRIDGGVPKIDGHLDDAAWENGEWGTNFTQKTPYEGDKPSQKTSFKILYDEKNLYVGIRAYDTEPDKIVRRMSRRDNRDGDWVEIIFDSYFDRRTGFAFSVSAAGVKNDMLISDDGEKRDASWDPIWYVKTAVNRQSWDVEMRIPLSQLRFGRKDKHAWGLYVARFLYRKQETCEWKLIPRQASGLVSWFGLLEGLRQIKSKRPIELLPYGVGKMQRFEKEEGNPFATGKLSNITGGLDGKIGVTNDLTLDFTINPDFGQVEADPSEVNLTAFETFFQEKRPFFVEGKNILNYQISGGDDPFSTDNLFYSRRIGRNPHHYPDTGDNQYVHIPESTTILAAFKLTGKTRKGLSIGIMESLTAKERAEIDFFGQRQYETVEPLTNYFVLRVQKDYHHGNTGFGGIFTATHRDLKNEPQLNFLHRAAYSGGLDFFHYWKNKQWSLTVKTVVSHVQGDKEALLRDQRSSLRYYQRPDADYVTFDQQRTSLSGHGGNLTLGKLGGGRWQFAGGITWRSPGLELNDVGYLRSADKILQWGWIGFRTTRPFSIFRNVNFYFSQHQQWNFGGERLSWGGLIGTFMEFKNYWSLSSGIEFGGSALSNDALRGGPSLKYPASWSQWLSIYSDPRKKLNLELDIYNLWYKFSDIRQITLSGGVTYRPFNTLSLSIHPLFSSNKQNLQYVGTLQANHQERYIFAYINQKTLAITMRLNYSITPDLSLQFYGQPFISSGQYTDFKHITQPRADDYYNRFHIYNENQIYYDADEQYYYINEGEGMRYGFGDPNFKFLQFRSNLVIRWEYTPGSTFYLVWSQGRTDIQAGDIVFSPGNDLRDLFRVHPHNVFLIKFTHRLKI